MFSTSEAGLRPKHLESLDIDGLAKFLSSGDRSVAFLTGAGMSVAAGIPDFRSQGGMYDTLCPELLTASVADRSRMAEEPTTVVSWDLFSRNQLPYLEVRRPLIKGIAERRWKATLSHFFVGCCYRRGLLRRLYTQNIDGLDFQTGIPEELLISVHGTMGTASCEFCGQGVPLSGFRDDVAANIKDIYGQDACAPKESQPIICKSCARPGVKPDTVLYGRSLPDRFFSCMGEDMKELDVLIIAGTSLTVSPANQLVNAVPESCVRVVVNNEPVGSSLGICYGTESRRDIFLQGTCDSVFLELATRLGWRHDLASSSAKMSEASAAMLAL